MNIRHTFNSLLALLLLSLLSAHQGSRAATLTVGLSGCDHVTLESAIANSQTNDELRLRAQTFSDVNVNLFHNLTIRGGYQNCGDQFPGINSSSVIEGDPNAGDSVFEIEGTGTAVTLVRLTISGGTEDVDHGGAIDVASGNTLTLATVTISDNESDLGGAIYLDDGAVLRHTGPVTISDNSADHGAGIYADEGAIVDLTTGGLNPFTLELNNAVLNGGGLYLASAASLLTDTLRLVTIKDSLAVNGGGIYAVTDAVIDAQELILSNNDALTGGGLFVAGDGSAATGTNFFLGSEVQVLGNEAVDGGGIYLAAGANYGAMIEAEFEDNFAARDGGALFLAGGSVELNDIDVRNNTADRDGGGLHTSTPVLTARGLFVGANNAGRDGGGWFANDGLITLRNPENIINGNTAGANGGGMALTTGALLSSAQNGGQLPVLSMANNRATSGNGGGLFVMSAAIDVEWAWIGVEQAGNQAPMGWGGGLYLDTDNNWSLINSRVRFNTADIGGGLVSLGDAGVTVAANMTTSSGPSAPLGTVRCDPFQLPEDTYCSEFRGNSASNQVGGVYLANEGSRDRTFDGVAFIANDGAVGSALYSQAGRVDIRNALFADNGTAPAIRTLLFGGMDILHSTFTENRGSGVVQGNGSTGMFIYNSLFWDNAGSDVIPGSSGAQFDGDCNLSQDGTAPGMVADPQFITTSRGNYRLSSGSPALDACVNSNDVVDLDGVSRPNGVDYDIGAFEGDWGVSDVLFADGLES